ncbi:hypothetical protein [Parasphingorhabdus sp.]|uniref:hypothetical protein n=1 Tax=Parasphingorhabdus sp. TaxID=2709688 RepID=UPI003FA7DD51
MLAGLGKLQCQFQLISRFCLSLGEKVNLLSDDFATVMSDVLVVGRLGIMDTSCNHYHGTLGDMFCNAFADAVEAGNAMPLLSRHHPDRGWFLS